MCGITGYYCFNEACQYINEFNSSVEFLNHRGPDHHGGKINDYAALGHTRLSIIDLSDEASQPMLSEDENFAISFNGEIYNYIELKEKLKLKGAHFKTNSDTEVILRGFELMGDGIFELMKGMFSLAIYYKKQNQLILARDRFGIKPLYYYKEENKLFFASEMGALLEYPIPRKLNHESLTKYFRFNYIPGNESMIEGIKQVDPGYYIIIDELGIRKHQYYKIKNAVIKIDFRDAINHIHKLLDQSVSEHLIADVPVASFLSGGLDSSIISMLASKHHPGLQTFSAGLSEYPYFDESKYGKMFSKQINTNHHSFDLSENKIIDSVEDILNGFSEPFADSSAIAYNLLSKKTSEHVKVVLSGDGADEVFGGYRKHKAEWLIQNNILLAKLSGILGLAVKEISGSRNNFGGNRKRRLKKWISGTKLSNEERYLLWASIQTESEVQQLLKTDSKSRVLDYLKIGNINDVLEADMRMVLPGDMLTKVDRMSMQYGLEVRTPFLDHDLVDFVFSLPSKWKLKGGIRKNLLKEAFKKELPDYIVKRKKKGFEVPLWAWLNGPLKDLMLTLLSDEKIKKTGLFNIRKVNALISQTFSNEPGDAPATIWALMVFQVWFNKYKPHI